MLFKGCRPCWARTSSSRSWCTAKATAIRLSVSSELSKAENSRVELSRRVNYRLGAPLRKVDPCDNKTQVHFLRRGFWVVDKQESVMIKHTPWMKHDQSFIHIIQHASSHFRGERAAITHSINVHRNACSFRDWEACEATSETLVIRAIWI